MSSQATVALKQVTKYVQREILNHRRLIHPHIVEMREVHPAYPRLHLSVVSARFQCAIESLTMLEWVYGRYF